MSQAGKAAANVKRAAEREHARPPRDEEKRKSDSESAEAHPTLTDTRLRSGHPQRDDRRDKPVDAERDKDLKEGGVEGAARKERGRA